MTDRARDALINRREAVARVAMLLGGVSLVAEDALVAAAAQDDAARSAATAAGTGTFTTADIALLDEVAETILPATSTPGARAARTGAFMALMVTDTYGERDQAVFRDGMRQLDEACRRMHGVAFMAATPAQRLALLEALDRAQKTYMEARAAARDATPVHYFRMMKELALLGYFTSEIGCTQAQRYIESPGRFDPCVPHQPGERTWANHA